MGTPTVPRGFPGMGSPRVPLGWVCFSRGFPRVAQGFHICELDAILQNEIWPFGAQRKKRKLNVENKMQFGWGFINEKSTSIRLVCSGVINQSCLGNFRFSKLNAIYRTRNCMQCNNHFISKKLTNPLYVIPEAISGSSN